MELGAQLEMVQVNLFFLKNSHSAILAHELCTEVYSGLHLPPRKSAQCFVRGNGEKLAILGHDPCELFRVSVL